MHAIDSLKNNAPWHPKAHKGNLEASTLNQHCGHRIVAARHCDAALVAASICDDLTQAVSHGAPKADFYGLIPFTKTLQPTSKRTQ